MRELLISRICGVVPARATRATKQKHKPNNRPEGFRGRKESPVMTTSKKSALISTVATLLSLVVITLPGTASAFSAAADFSSSNNPNGAWSYGYTYGLGATFNLDATNAPAYMATPLSGWLSDVASD